LLEAAQLTSAPRSSRDTIEARSPLPQHAEQRKKLEWVRGAKGVDLDGRADLACSVWKEEANSCVGDAVTEAERRAASEMGLERSEA
jgi:hypothetical protein